MTSNGIITLIIIIFVLLLIYIIMKGISARMKKKMDNKRRFRR
ncbi:MAG TPA: hypothetical protein PLK17_11290 [Bacteroidales bacterium]|jgi:hypothetical protein|nr:hypothetical protein [Bacteroidales bacterium]HOO67025.1 hypothetical protein [Bacteroidales bacterium]HPE22787.1 hypothetical protein [Bacteroidales bacterium]HPJ06086.1 hypothetical protein [Bacteroidales bacterium]HPQ64817.1 hypothetical protein [Bacteroidales bacterium]